jgi:hypothetical protein
MGKTKALSTEEQEQILKDPTHEMYPNVVVMRLLHSRHMTNVALAEYLQLTRSAVSKMLNRPNAVHHHAPKIAKFFSVSESDITGARQSSHPADALPLGAPAMGHNANPMTVLQDEVGKTLDSNVIPIPPGWALVRVPGKSRGVDWLLCGPLASKPREGDLVVALTSDGRQWCRAFNRDEIDEKRIVLTSPDNSERPIVLRDKEIVEMRRVIAPVANLR